MEEWAWPCTTHSLWALGAGCRKSVETQRSLGSEASTAPPDPPAHGPWRAPFACKPHLPEAPAGVVPPGSWAGGYRKSRSSPPELPGRGRPLRSADRARASRLVLPGPAGRRHKVGHRSAVPSCRPSPQAVEAGQGAGHGQPWALRQPSQGGWASAASPGCVDAATPLTPQPQFPHLYCGGAASGSQHNGSTGPADLPRDGAGGAPRGERSREGAPQHQG